MAIDAPTDHTREVIHLAHLHLLLYRLLYRPSEPGAEPALGRPEDGELAATTLALAGARRCLGRAGGRLGRTIEALLHPCDRPARRKASRGRRRQISGVPCSWRPPAATSGSLCGLGPAMAQLLAEYNPPPEQAAYTARLRSVLNAARRRSRPEPRAQPDQSALVEPLSDASATCCA